MPPFTFTGVDYIGPFEVTVGRRHEKRWIVIFTCLAMRAIHLEVASSLDTSSCIMCIKNFMNRRGTPREIISDNGTNLRAAEKELKNIVQTLDCNKIISATQPTKPTTQYIKWQFIPPAAPHFGGAWERMVRTVKSSFYHVMKARAPKDEVFRSAVIEVENTVNSRPLHYVSTKDDCPPAISPNDLLRPPNTRTHFPPDPQLLDTRKQWAIAQDLSHEFWKRWLREYIPTIANRSKWYDETKPLERGQLVLIIDNNLKRGEWKKGVVVDLNLSKDGRIRSATVKTGSGTYVRPVVKLAVVNCNPGMAY
jgi:hypothetical protein